MQGPVKEMDVLGVRAAFSIPRDVGSHRIVIRRAKSVVMLKRFRLLEDDTQWIAGVPVDDLIVQQRPVEKQIVVQRVNLPAPVLAVGAQIPAFADEMSEKVSACPILRFRDIRWAFGVPPCDRLNEEFFQHLRMLCHATPRLGIRRIDGEQGNSLTKRFDDCFEIRSSQASKRLTCLRNRRKISFVQKRAVVKPVWKESNTESVTEEKMAFATFCLS